jgi:hypothetical protein
MGAEASGGRIRRWKQLGRLADEGGLPKGPRNKTSKWKSGNISDLKVAIFGANIAVLHYTFTYDAELQGKHRARSVICSDTWVNDSGAWKAASTHCSMVKGE